jgi:hypothetical protein
MDWPVFFQYGVPTGILVILLVGLGALTWRLLPRVERSIDSHLEVMKVFAEHLPKQTKIIEDGFKSLGEKTDKQTAEIARESAVLDARTPIIKEIHDDVKELKRRMDT